MSKTRIFALVVVGIILAAVVTNPSRHQLEDAVAGKAEGILQKQLNYEHADAVQLGMTLFGDKMVREFVSNNVIVRNYYVFSTISIKWQGDETPVGGGAFRTVWLSPEIDKKADEIISVIKDL